MLNVLIIKRFSRFLSAFGQRMMNGEPCLGIVLGHFLPCPHDGQYSAARKGIGIRNRLQIPRLTLSKFKRIN